MTTLIHSATPLSVAELNLRALDDWRRAARCVSARWDVYLLAERDACGNAFSAYLTALDTEEAAAEELAHLTLRAAA
jgi:hypothetical protein